MALFAEKTLAQVQADILAAHPGLLKGDWKMKDADGTTIIDSSGNGHTMTEVGNPTFQQASLARGPDGKSIAFDGNDSFRVADHADFNFGSALTVRTISKASTQTGLHAIASQWRTAGNLGWTLHHATGLPTFQITDDGVITRTVDDATRVDDGNVHVIVGIFDGSTLFLYVDGILVATTSFSGSIFNSTHDVAIGDWATPLIGFVGDIEGVQVWNAVWTPQEVAADARAVFAYQNGQYDAEEAAWDAEHGAATFALKLDDASVIVDEIAGDTVAFSGSPAVDVFGPVGTLGELALRCDGVNDAVSLGTGAVKPGDGNTFHHRFWFKGPISTTGDVIVDGRDNAAAEFGFYVEAISSGTAVRLHMRHGATDETTIDVSVDVTGSDWQMGALGYRSSDDQFFLRIDQTEVTGTLGGTYDDQSTDGTLLGQEYDAGAFEAITYSRYRCYSRYPATGELNAIYTAGRSFIFNIDTTAANNPDYTTKAAALTDYTAITTVENLMHWFEFDYNIVSASVIDFLPAASTSTAAWESASRRLKAFVSPISWANSDQTDPASKGLIQFTGTQQDLTTFVLQPTAIPFAQVEGFVLDSGTAGHSGSVFANAAVGAKWDSCRLTHDGDLTSPTNALNLIDSKSGKDVTLTNSLVELNNDDQGGADPGVAKGAGTVNLQHTTIVQLGTETAIDAKPSTGTITNCVLGAGFADVGGTGDSSVFQDTTEVTTGDLVDIFKDVSLFDYRLVDGGLASQTGTAIDGVFTDAFGITWSIPASPNTTHINRIFTGVDLAAGPSSIESGSGSSFKPTQEHLFT